MNPVRTILEYFRVKKTIRYHGSIENLESILDTMVNKPLEKEEFYLSKIEMHKYALNPTISLGTIQTSVNGMITSADDITVQLNLKPNSDNKIQEIKLQGSLHKAHLLIFFTFTFLLIIFLSVLINTGNFVGLILVLALWPIWHLWFNFVWTSQEKALIEEVKLALHVRIRAGIGSKGL